MAKTDPFKRYSNAYEQWFEDNAELYEAELMAIKGIVDTKALKSLEVGVGTGKFAAPLGIRYGVEPAEEMAIKAREKGIQVYEGTAENLPFSEQSFDLILMVTVICFLDNISKALQEAYRVLKPDGYIVVAFIDKHSQLGRQYEAKKEKSRFYNIANFLSAQEVVDYLKHTGFNLLRSEQCLIPDKPLDTVYNGFGKGAFVVTVGQKG